MEAVREALRRHWGYGGFLPLQAEAMGAIRKGRDCLVVLPTGGGKSLCYQAPAVTLPGVAVVVSPLISLMKDQVDALTECGVAAGRVDSSLSWEEQQEVLAGVRQGQVKMLYLSPERLVTDGCLELLRQVKVSFVAVDEAHCVSMWGHDFRPEYRQLGMLKKVFPGVTIGAYTATATEQVREDIVEQLRLKGPEVLVGSFDRPNLVYKVRPRRSMVKQVCEVLDRHKNESGIVYCIRRRDVDEMCVALASQGYKAAPYHAGMSDRARQTNQEAFIQEKVDTIVATIAFGMGIDKSNVRYVVHAGMPKSLENYQQESGRAGRDGLEAECCLFYGGGDYGTWKTLMSDMGEKALEIAMVKLNAIYSFCSGGVCRHKAILQYFGQEAAKEDCGACDVCLGEMDYLADSLVTAQKILSCVVRLEERFGGDYTAGVLVGSRERRIGENGHDRLSTYGLLSEHPKHAVRDWIEQLAGGDYIEKRGEYNVLGVTAKGWAVLKGQEKPRLLKPARKEGKTSKVASDSWEGVDRGLFEALRRWRAGIAAEKAVPAFVIFGDATLRDMARRRPGSREGFLQVKGVGENKCRQYGKMVLAAIAQYCKANGVEMDVDAKPVADGARLRALVSVPVKRAFAMFKRKCAIKDVAEAIGRAESTALQYLVEYIEREKVTDASPWVNAKTVRAVGKAAEEVGDEKMRPIFDKLEGKVEYGMIRIALACLRNMDGGRKSG